MANIWFDGAFGDLPLTITRISTDGGRDIAVQSPARGNRHYLQDRGRKLGKCEVTIMFTDQPSLAPFLDRYDQFRALANSGDAQIFSHPLDGSYRARAEGMQVTAESTACVEVTCAFLPEDEPQPVFPIGAGVAPLSGVGAVSAAAASFASALAAIPPIPSAPGIPSPPSLPALSDGILATVGGWSDAVDLQSAQVFAEVADLTEQVSQAVNDYQLATDVARWPVYRALMNLSFQAQRAADAFTADDPTTVIVTVARAAPLLAICAEVYGAASASDRSDAVARANRIATPNLVPAGTVLTMPGAGARA